VRPENAKSIEEKLIALSKAEGVKDFDIQTDIGASSLRQMLKMHIDAIEAMWHEKRHNESKIIRHLDAIRELLR